MAFSPGFTYLVTPRIGLGMSFGRLYFSHAGIKTVIGSKTTKTSDNEYGLDLKTSSLNFGVSFYFGGGKEKK